MFSISKFQTSNIFKFKVDYFISNKISQHIVQENLFLLETRFGALEFTVY